MKRLYTLISIILISFICFIYILYKPKDYKVNYTLDGFDIDETYVKKTEKYKVFINYNDKIFPLILDYKFNKNRKIINKIKKYTIENEICLSIYSKEFIYPVCYINDNLVDFRQLSKEMLDNFNNLIKDYNKDILDEYKNIKIYNLLDKEIFIWNYKGFDYLSDNNKDTILIIEKDEYDALVTFKDKKHLILPNYDQEYYYNELYIINSENKNLKKINLDYDISYFSRFLGSYRKDYYILDYKNKREYKINLSKEETDMVGSITKEGIYYDGKSLTRIPIDKLINDNLTFYKPVKFSYKIIDNNLYHTIDNFKILLSYNVKDIVSIKNDEVYYIKNDKLYRYSNELGEILMLENPEWNFNYKNKIFIFD